MRSNAQAEGTGGSIDRRCCHRHTCSRDMASISARIKHASDALWGSNDYNILFWLVGVAAAIFRFVSSQLHFFFLKAIARVCE